MGIHEQSAGKTDEWYTPPHVFHALGCSFDTDVASPGRCITPWIPAWRFIEKNSQDNPWEGFVWMNPPFSGRDGKAQWLERFFAHGNGIALTPDRTSAPWWQKYAPRAELILFIAPKLKFIGADGKPGKQPAQGTCLYGIGARSHEPLLRAQAAGLGTILAPKYNAVSDFAGSLNDGYAAIRDRQAAGGPGWERKV